MSKAHTCPKCTGRKRVDGETCPTCAGSGVVFEGVSEAAEQRPAENHLDLTYRP